jgi:hypothetical protein
MKIPLFVCLVAFRSLSLAGEISPPSFPALRIQAPSLSLIESARQGMLPLFGEAALRAFDRVPRVARPPARVSHMPVILPSGNLHDPMVVKMPNGSIDYRLLVKTPGVKSVK